jgi:hypothetical protein
MAVFVRTIRNTQIYPVDRIQSFRKFKLMIHTKTTGLYKFKVFEGGLDICLQIVQHNKSLAVDLRPLRKMFVTLRYCLRELLTPT